MEEFRDKKQSFHIVYNDFKKAYDELQTDITWWILRKKVTKLYTETNKSKY